MSGGKRLKAFASAVRSVICPAAFAVCLAVLPAVCPGVFAEESAGAEPVRLMVVSDLHYLSPTLFESGRDYLVNLLQRGDGKVTQYSGELLSALTAEARHQRPDAVIVTGDLTFNGEKQSHLELAAAFSALRAEGIPVWVIPGNHDINNPYARAYVKYSISPEENVSPAEFAEIYRDSLGVLDGGDMSYLVPLTEKIRLLMCDFSVYTPEVASYGLIPPARMEWPEEIYRLAGEEDAVVLSATHQSLIPHTAFMGSGTTVLNGEPMAEAARASGRSHLNLSGHLHIQHIAEDRGLWDIASGAFGASPHPYGWLVLNPDGSFEYESRSLCADHLPEGFADETRAFFEDVTRLKHESQLADADLTDAEKEAMLDYAARANYAYFSGAYRSDDPAWREDPAFGLWRGAAGSPFFAGYLTETLTAEINARDMRRLSVAADGTEIK